MARIKKIWNFLYKCGCEISDDQVWPFSAQAAFYLFMSFFPFVMFLFSLLQFLPVSETELTSVISILVPGEVANFLKGIVEEAVDNSSGTVLSITIIATLWSASRGIIAITDGLNEVYDVKETRNYFVVRGMGMLYTVLFAISIIILLGVFVFGNQITMWLESVIPSLKGLTGLVQSVRTVVGISFLALLFMAMYKALPNRKSFLFREIPGAVIAAVGWVGFSYLFSFYIDNLSNMSATYGSLTTVILCMLWLEFCMFILLMGAEINSFLCSSTMQNFLRRKFPKLISGRAKKESEIILRNQVRKEELSEIKQFAVETAKEKTQELGELAKEKTQELGELAKEKTQELGELAKEKTQKLGETAKKDIPKKRGKKRKNKR